MYVTILTLAAFAAELHSCLTWKQQQILNGFLLETQIVFLAHEWMLKHLEYFQRSLLKLE